MRTILWAAPSALADGRRRATHSSGSRCTCRRRSKRAGRTYNWRYSVSIYHITIIGPPVYQCGEHWSGGPGSLVRGAGKDSLLPPIGDDSRVTTSRVTTRRRRVNSGRSGRTNPN